MKRTGQIIGSIGLIVCVASAIWLRYFVVTARELGNGFLLAAVGSGIAAIGVGLYKFASSRESNQNRLN